MRVARALRLLLVGLCIVATLPAAAQGRRVSAIFSDDSELQTLMRVEAALASAQADMGIIPREAAAAIVASAKPGTLTPKEVADERAKVGHPLVALLKVWEPKLPGGAGEWLHYGATTQDIYDTAHLLMMRESAAAILRELSSAELAMMKLAEAHRATPMMGRTVGRHALPITFGLKVSRWAAENRRNMERLKAWLARANSGMLSGAVGSYASLGPRAFELEADVMRRLGLAEPLPADWKGSRDLHAEYGQVLALVAKTWGKVAQEVFILLGDDIRELEEPNPGVGSSTMPHKVNPRLATRVVALSRVVPRHAEVLLDWMVSIYERDQISNAATLRDVSVASEQLVAAARGLVETLVVRPQDMRRNLGNTNGLVMAEHAMFLLGARIGKQTAHDVIQDIAREAWQKNLTLRAAIEAHPEVAKHFEPGQLERELDPARYLGLSPEATDRALAAIRRARESDRF